MLAVTIVLCPSSFTGPRNAPSTSCASLVTASCDSTSGTKSVNSSPPKRATSEDSGVVASSRSPSATSSSSPTLWPRLSLTTLKRSRSMNITAERLPVSIPRSSAASSCSMNMERFGRFVSGS